MGTSGSNRATWLGRLLVVFCTLTCATTLGCEAPDDADCGIVEGEVTVIFREGTTRAEVYATNAKIGAVVIMAPSLSTAYRMRVPPWLTVDEAIDFYESKPQVQSAMWAINYCPA